MPVTWPLVGRSEELDVVIQGMRDDESGGVAIAGAAGVGKTRLAREATSGLVEEFAVEWVAATPSAASIPFGAFAHLVPDLDAPRSSEDPLWMLRRISATLLARAAGTPAVVVVDDAQWLDPRAAALVHHLVTTRATRVLLTLRTGEPAPDAMSALWKDAFVERVELQPLTRSDSDALVETVLDGPVDRPTLGRLSDLSGGNPLFLRELVLGILERGGFSCVDGVWRWVGSFEASVRLSSILDDRVARVSANGRMVLDYLAVGEPLPLEILVLLRGAAEVAEVERAGLAVVGRDGLAVRLCHPLYGEQLCAQMGVLARKEIVGQLAVSFEAAVGSSRGDLLRVASWQLENGGLVDAALLAEAAEVARAAFDLGLAERLARRAVESGGGLGASLALGWALNGQGRSREALRVLDPLADEVHSGREHADIAAARYSALTFAYGFRPEFDAVLREAEERVDEPQTRAYLRVQRVALLALAGRFQDAIALAPALDNGVDEVTALQMVPALGSALAGLGKWDKAVAVGDRVVESALRHRDDIPFAPLWVMSVQLGSFVGAGRLDDADALVELVDATDGSTRGDVAGFLAYGRGLVALRRGDARTAVRWLRETVGGMRDVSEFRLPRVLAYLTEACALIGDADGATAASAEADEHIDHTPMFEGLIRGARAWAAIARGQRTAATELALDTADWAHTHGQPTAELQSLHDALRFGANRHAAQRLVAVAPAIEGAWARGLATHAAATLDDDGAELDAAATQFDEIGARLLAAEAAADAADAYRSAGLLARSERSETRARVLLSRCDGTHSPTINTLEAPLPLTAREREVAHLAARGLTAKVIGEHLKVSTRTIEGHLYRAYMKLGVVDRTGLARILTTSAES